MSTFMMTSLSDFLLFLFEEETEEQLWEVWLNKETEHADSFEKFKEQSIKKQKRKQQASHKRRMSDEEEKDAIAKAEKILNRRGGNT